MKKPRAYVPVTPSKKRQGSLKDTKPSLEEHENSNDDDDIIQDTEEPYARFYCRLAVDSRRGIFYEFAWEHHHKDALSRAKPPVKNSGPNSTTHLGHSWALGHSWMVKEKATGESSNTKTKNVKVRRVKGNASKQEEISESDVVDSGGYDDLTESECDSIDTKFNPNGSDKGDSLEDDATVEPYTPSRKRKHKDEEMPRNVKRNKTLAQPTPHSKAALARRRNAGSLPRKHRNEPIFGISSLQLLNSKTSMAHLPKDPWLRAMHALHVGSRPDSLPCREEEFNKVLRCIGELLEEGSGGCVCKSIVICSSAGSGRS
jgi:origin recognition complex subunit 1